MRACTRVNVYCTRKAIVYKFTKLHDRRITNVGVGVRGSVGPMEFQLKVKSSQARSLLSLTLVQLAAILAAGPLTCRVGPVMARVKVRNFGGKQ